MFKPVDSAVSFPEIEEKVIEYWKKNKTFEKSVESRPKDKYWTFLDGPPFITGLPHYGTLLASIPKDIFPRFWTMKGYRVRRVWGWDVHGLPAENKVETKLGLTRKRDIEEKIGVKKFIELCKEYVSESSKEWEWYVDHIGRWVDFKNAYKTMDMSYMETVMWVFKQMYDKGHIYKGLRVSLYCPHCSTPISNFEVAMDPDNYKELTEPADTYKYQLKDEPDTYILAWSTTPWNKIVTPALAVNPKLTYVKVKQGNEHYILAESTLKMLKEEPYTVVATMKGKDLVGKSFVPHYDFYEIEEGKRAFVIIPGEFVTAEEGTGVVTIAAYGEEDLIAMKKENIQIVMHVDDEGMLKKDVPMWGGMYYLKVNPLVNEDLKKRELLYREDPHTHTIPTCWRCHTRLYYAPQNAWYVDIQKLKPALKKNNEVVNWFPEHFKYGRFLKSLESAPDWCISRSRYWGSPVPVWECEDGHRYVPGSIKELEEQWGKPIKDLHKPDIDEVVVDCPECSKKATRVPEVLDSWIEAGSASLAERHFPFEAGLKLESFFPPDFIVEYTGQIRAWFYVLHVISTALFDTNAFKNVVVTGVILGTDGRKMSKNYGNYPDPKELLQKYGGDALRLYLMGSPIMHGEDIIISEEQYRNQVRGVMLILWNSYKFFVTYAQIEDWKPSKKSTIPEASNPLDRWILSRLAGNLERLTQAYENYDTPLIVSLAQEYIQDVSSWYIRRSRDRLGPTASDQTDKQHAYETLYFVLVQYVKALAPLIPFTTEEIYRNLTDEESVHLTDWFDLSLYKPLVDVSLEESMKYAQDIASMVHAFRKEHKLKVRMPLKKLSYKGPSELSEEIKTIVGDETNVYELIYDGKSDQVEIAGDVTPANQDIAMGEARELIRNVQILRKEKACDITERITIEAPNWPKEHEEFIKQKTLADSIVCGDNLNISKHHS